MKKTLLVLFFCWVCFSPVAAQPCDPNCGQGPGNGNGNNPCLGPNPPPSCPGAVPISGTIYLVIGALIFGIIGVSKSGKRIIEKE